MKTLINFTLSVVLGLLLTTASHAAGFAGKKVLYIDSYHAGYDWSDGVTSGVKSVIDKSGADLKIHRMDTKRNASEDFKKEAALKAKAVIESYQPNVVIASDDNASKYLIEPYYKDAALPFVFCGVNWDASVYGFPYSNVTGMVEIEDIDGLTKQLAQFAKGDRLGYIGGDVATDRKVAENMEKVLGRKMVKHFAKDFAEFKTAWKALQSEADMLFFFSQAGIKGWNDDEAKSFIAANTSIPTGASQLGTVPYVMVGYIKIAEEQGEWAANTTLKIMGGASPKSIPIVTNERGRLVLNAKMANAANIEMPYSLIEVADSVIE